MRMQSKDKREHNQQAAAGLRRRITRTIGVALMLCALVCFCLPASVYAADGRGARLTGYAPLYLPSVVSITVQAAPATFGTVTGGGAGIAPGENVTVTARPGTGYYFAGWYEDNVLVSDSASYTFRADRDRHLIASFSDNPEAASPNQGNSQDNNANASGSEQDNNANANASGSSQDQNANTNASTDNQSATAGTSTAGGAAGSGTDSTTGTNAGAGNASSGSDAASTTGSSRIEPYVPANSNDMPTTGVGDMYRVPITIVLLLFGLIAVMISIPVGKRKRR